MANVTGQSHKLGKQNKQQHGVTNYPSNATSNATHIHDKYNENIYVASKESLFSETYSDTQTAVQDETDDIIQNPYPYQKPQICYIRMSLLMMTHVILKSPGETFIVPLQQAPRFCWDLIH